MGGGVNGRQELGDAHAQVAVHTVGDDLAAIIVQLDVAQVVLRPVVLQRHVHARVQLHLGVVFPESGVGRLALPQGAPLRADVGLNEGGLVDDDLNVDELGVHLALLRERRRRPLTPLLGRARPLFLEGGMAVCGHDNRHLAAVDILAARVLVGDEEGVGLGAARVRDVLLRLGHVHVVPRRRVLLVHELAEIAKQRVGVLVAPGLAALVVLEVEDVDLRAVEEAQIRLQPPRDVRLAALGQSNHAQHMPHTKSTRIGRDRRRHCCG